MMWRLSKCITRETNLNDLALLGLGLSDDAVAKHIKNKKDEFNVAVYGVLKEWSDSKENKEDAYQILYEALGKDGVDMKDYRKALDQNF